MKKKYTAKTMPHLREVTKKEEVAVAENATTTPTCDKSSQVGNAAALLEALRKIHLIATTNINECACNDSDRTICKIAEEALAKPPRNCDVGTAKKQSLRFEDFCNLHRSCEKGCRDCPLLNCEPSCEFEWAHMPYRKGANDEQK